MANSFDTEWDDALEEEMEAMGEVLQVGGVDVPIVVLEYARRSVIGASGGRRQQIEGQIVMTAIDWEKLAAGKESLPARLRGHDVRLYRHADSADLRGVVLEVSGATNN